MADGMSLALLNQNIHSADTSILLGFSTRGLFPVVRALGFIQTISQQLRRLGKDPKLTLLAQLNKYSMSHHKLKYFRLIKYIQSYRKEGEG